MDEINNGVEKQNDEVLSEKDQEDVEKVLAFYIDYSKKISEAYESIEKIGKRYEGLSKWVLTTDLAVLGFILTILLQIKLEKEIIPYKINALVSILAFSISIVLGFISHGRDIMLDTLKDISNLGKKFADASEFARKQIIALKLNRPQKFNFGNIKPLEIKKSDFEIDIKRLRKKTSFLDNDFEMAVFLLVGIVSTIVFVLRYLFV